MNAELVLREIMANDGFLTDDTASKLAVADRLRQVIVRCNGCRFICAAQDIQHLCGIIDHSDVDYVRDVSLLAEDPAYRDDFRKLTADPPIQSRVFNHNSNPPDTRIVAPQSEYVDYGGAFDGFCVTSDADPGL